MPFYWVVWKRKIYFIGLYKNTVYFINKSKLFAIRQVLLNTSHCIISFTPHGVGSVTVILIL